MIDMQNVPKAWAVIEWGWPNTILCAAHAEGRFGAALYREPRLKGVEQMPDGREKECARCQTKS